MTDNIYKLYKAVDSIVKSPYDVYEICATIEALGYSDKRVAEEFGFGNVFDVGTIIYEQIARDSEEKIINKKLDYKNLLDNILRGLLGVFPLIISIIAIFTIDMNLWSYMDNTQTTVERATLLSLGTVLGVILSGGFSQFYVSKGYGYLDRKLYSSLWIEIKNVIILCAIFSLGIGVIIGCVFLFIGYYRVVNIGLFIIYFLLLSISWATVPIFNILKRQYILVINFCISLGVAYLLAKVIGINILISQMIAITVFFFLNVIYSYITLYVLKDGGKNLYYRPKKLITLYSSLPYFLYGFLYYLFIFSDKLVVWGCNNNMLIEPVIRLKGDYEIGTNWGIITALIPIILIEAVVSAYINNINILRKQFSIKNRESFINKNLKDFCKLNMYLMIFNTIFSCITMSAIINILLKYHIILGPYLSSNTYMVFTFASCGYMLIATGLFNNIILMYFSQHKYLIKLLIISFGVNIITSFILSRLLGYHFAVFGFFISCIVFYLLSYFYCIRVFENIDYYFYECQG